MPPMSQNDLLNSLFSLNPFFITILVWFWGFGSLMLVAVKTHTVSSVLKHPGIMIGDFFLIPLSVFLVTYFYQSIENPTPIVTSVKWNYVIVLGFILTVISAIRWDLTSLWWFPHLIFYWFMTYTIITFLSKGLFQLTTGNGRGFLWLVWFGVLIAMSIHELLPIIFGAKIFPKP